MLPIRDRPPAIHARRRPIQFFQARSVDTTNAGGGNHRLLSERMVQGLEGRHNIGPSRKVCRPPGPANLPGDPNRGLPAPADIVPAFQAFQIRSDALRACQPMFRLSPTFNTTGFALVSWLIRSAHFCADWVIGGQVL